MYVYFLMIIYKDIYDLRKYEAFTLTQSYKTLSQLHEKLDFNNIYYLRKYEVFTLTQTYVNIELTISKNCVTRFFSLVTPF